MTSFHSFFRISTRLSLGFCTILCLLVLIAVYSISQNTQLGSTFETYSERSDDAIKSSDLQRELLLLQAAISRLASLNSKVNQNVVETAYRRFSDSFNAQPRYEETAALSNAVRDLRDIVIGSESLAAVQDSVDDARGEMSRSVAKMSDTIAMMMRDSRQMGDFGAIVTIQDRVLRARMLIRSYQFTGSLDEIAAAVAALRDAERKFDQFGRMDSAIADHPLVREGRRNLDAMFGSAAKIRAAVEKREKLIDRAIKTSEYIGEQTESMRSLALNTMLTTGKDTNARVSRALYNAVGMACIAVVVALALSLLISRSISVPIKRMTIAMRRLSEGEVETIVPETERYDEIGEMARATQVFKTAALERQRIEAETAAALHAASEARRSSEIEATERAIAGEREYVITKFGAGLRSLASGNLDYRIHEKMPGEYESLRRDFNEALERLCDTLRAVAASANSIDSGSWEISQGSNDLSRRTERQAASLEQTAASLEQITVNVADSFKRTEEARSIAQEANSKALQSAKVVEDAVEAMGRIEKSSQLISNIIGVIDEIAFQTNLLALNAGVEAARAGDAGKGFAVVAQEVRELAQRSAKAAREIKDLIQHSSVAVQTGVDLVSRAGDALKNIESCILTINHHMDTIATSAREQAVSVAEVNTAVSEMDQVTQQNAALVEESTAASTSLAHEAATLRQLIAQFQLDNSAQLRQAWRSMAS